MMFLSIKYGRQNMVFRIPNSETSQLIFLIPKPVSCAHQLTVCTGSLCLEHAVVLPLPTVPSERLYSAHFS